MSNFIDYMKWRGDLSFDNDEACIIDYAILSQIVIMNLSGLIPDYPSTEQVTIKEICEKYFSAEYQKAMRLGLIIPQTILDLLKLMKDSKRFGNLSISNYLDILDENDEMQISAFTAVINDNLKVITFSGTDDTLVGWKENLNMIYKSPIAAQLKAVEYIEEAARLFDGDFIVCGHSKGGNMSLYGGIHVNDKVQPRIKKIINFDGPGLSKINEKEIALIKDLDKVITVIPQTSIVGRLFEHSEKCSIVKSNEVSFYQHDAFSWEILGKDFIYESELTKESQIMDQKIKSVISEMTEEEKVNFVQGLYNLLISTDSKSLLELSEKKKELTSKYLKLPREERRYIMKPILKLFSDITVFNMVLKAGKEAKQISKKLKQDNKA